MPYGGFLQARSIQGLAVGSLSDRNGQVETGQSASASDVENLLAPDTQLTQADGTFRVPFADLANQQVALFLVTDPKARSFDNRPVDLTVQSVVSANAAGTANVVQRSNVARGADIALIHVSPTFNKHGKPVDSEISGITIRGDGASITTRQPVNGPIVSTGSLGDLNLRGAGDIGDIVAASMFGDISPGSKITGSIVTTGLSTDPITGLVSQVAGDFGRIYLDDHNRLTTTNLSLGSKFAGSLLVAGNLLSRITINGGLDETSLIAAGGNLGALVGSTRLGGLTINGGDSGAILVGGDVLGPITVNGGLSFGSSILVGGSISAPITINGGVAGFLVSLGDVTGDVSVNGGLGSGGSIASGGSILGNLSINGGMAKNSSVVARGVIGNPVTGTRFTLNGNNRGIIAAKDAIQFARSANGSVFKNTAVNDPPSATVIDAIFTDQASGQPIQFTTNPVNLDGLIELLNHLTSLKVKNDKLTLGS